MQFTPCNFHLIVESVTDDVTASGLVLPTADHDKRPSYGRVVAVDLDSKRESESLPFSVGEIVAFDRYEAHQFDIREKKYFGVLENRIICIVDLNPTNHDS